MRLALKSLTRKGNTTTLQNGGMPSDLPVLGGFEITATDLKPDRRTLRPGLYYADKQQTTLSPLRRFEFRAVLAAASASRQAAAAPFSPFGLSRTSRQRVM